jgi:hypothetical protein
MKLSDLTDRQILIHLVYRVHGIEKRLGIRDKRVWGLTIVLVGGVASAIVALLIK